MARCMKDKKELRPLTAYEIEYEETLTDIKSMGLVFRHKKSGARVCVVSNDDENKVFIAGFKTPPSNNTGVPHIIEHTVLCGSRKFPLKEPFVELVKGSLNTFLNAMTYPDKTLYPVASCNEKDFQNLMDVYLDAIFYPNLYQKREIFEQEGWHYELEDINAPLKLNGVVYNEMKGAFSSKEEQLNSEIFRSLYKDTCYGMEAGGDPKVIPDLTYEEYIAFHKKYYHPSNCYLYLYGNMDIEEKLEWLDKEYLNEFDLLEVDAKIEVQQPYGISETTEYYSIGMQEDEKNKTYLSYNTIVGTSLDVETSIAMAALLQVLLNAPGAPVKQALLEAGIGTDILASFETALYQPLFSIVAKNTQIEKKEEFIQCLRTNFEKLVKNGINEKSLRAAINKLEFKYRESDYGQFPKGLMLGLEMFKSWLYDDKCAFSYLHGNQIFEALKQKIKTNYFEDLIETYLLNSKHVNISILAPKKGLLAEQEKELEDKLKAYKDSLSKEELEKLVLATKNLKEYQDRPSTKEELETIPLLKREDIRKEAPELVNQTSEIEKVPTIYHELFTNGIAYIRVCFDIGSIKEELLPYVGLMASVFGYIDTNRHSFLELSNEVNIHTGGITSSVLTINRKNDTKSYLPLFQIRAKALYKEMAAALSFMKEMMTEAKLDDTKRLKEIIQEVESKLQMMISMNSHVTAMNRAVSYFSNSAYFEELTGGISYYEFIKDLSEHFEEKTHEITRNLKAVAESLFCEKNLLFDITAEEEGYQIFKKEIKEFMKDFKEGGRETFIAAAKTGNLSNWETAPYHFALKKKQEGFISSGQVQYVARCGNYIMEGYQPSGALKVLRKILEYEYLWINIRVKGGAYGCMNNFSGIDGSSYFISYRDPNLLETNEIYEKTADYVRTFQADEREMTKYIIGTMSLIDTPLTPMLQGGRSFNALLSNVTLEDIQKERNEILSVTCEDIQKTADIVQTVIEQGNICVIGSDKKIQESKELFYEIKELD